MILITKTRAAVCGLILAASASSVLASSLLVKVNDAGGVAVPNAVVYAEAAGGQILPKLLRPAAIEQRNKTYLPLVSVVQAGAAITFPNNDTVRHQVYSFSPAKVFELKLYAGVPSTPVNTPYFAKTDAAGNARLENLPDGKYSVKTWHYSMPPNAVVLEKTITQQGADARLAIILPNKISTE
jgi:hypothetical protein